MRCVTLGEQPHLAEAVARLHAASWPPFLRHHRADNPHWPALWQQWADWQLCLLAEDGALAAVGHLAPLRWDGRAATLPAGWESALAQSHADAALALPPTALLGLAVLVAQPFQGQGLSRTMLEAMKAHGAARGLAPLLVPVRPTGKHRYPLTPMARYATWQRPDGAPLDPWLRTHWRLGGSVLGIAEASQVVEAPVAAWATWSGLALPDSGRYIVPNALAPLEVDRASDLGRLAEANVWLLHR